MSDRLLEALRATVCFSIDDAERAHELWGANCGPTALAAVLRRTLDAIRPYLGDFERKGYTNPTLMLDSLRRLGVTWRKADGDWPVIGLVRIQWEGPWTAPGVPMRVRYRHTHWIAASTSGLGVVNVFDVTPLLIMSLRSGAGLDGLQQVSRTAVFGELDWSPGVHEQCLGRVARDGQAHPVVGYFLIADVGSDPVVADVLGLKRQQAEGIVDPDADLIEDLQVDPSHVRRLAEVYLAQRERAERASARILNPFEREEAVG